MSKRKKKVGPLYRVPSQGSNSQAKCKTVVRGQGASKCKTAKLDQKEMAAMIERLEAKMNPVVIM